MNFAKFEKRIEKVLVKAEGKKLFLQNGVKKL